MMEYVEEKIIENREPVYHKKHAEMYDLSDIQEGLMFAYWRGYLTLEDEVCVKQITETVEVIKKCGTKICISEHDGITGIQDALNDWSQQNWYRANYDNGMILEIMLDSTVPHVSQKVAEMRNIGRKAVSVIKLPDFETAMKLSIKTLKNRKE